MQSIIRASKLEDIEPVAQKMRARDVEEVWAAAGAKPAAALEDCIVNARFAWTASDSNGPYAIFGVSHVGLDVGSPWLLATDSLYKHQKFFMRATTIYVRHMLESFPILMNYVDARHSDSIRWLRWAGFTFDKYVDAFGYERRPFIRFTKVRPCASH
jgi:hypothetical protein